MKGLGFNFEPIKIDAMQAMILAAGLGTRLQPHTFTKPKPLVEIRGVPMLEWVIRSLLAVGVDRLVINIHHFGEQVLDFLASKGNFGMDILISDERDMLLDTGGGLKRAARFFRPEPVLVHNTDVLCTSDLTALYQAHREGNSLVTLLVKHRPTSRSFLVNHEGLLCGWENHQTGERRVSRPGESPLFPVAYSCIQVVEPRLFSLLTEEGAFSLTDAYIRLSAAERIQTLCDDQCSWMDLGRTEHLRRAEDFVAKFL